MRFSVTNFAGLVASSIWQSRTDKVRVKQVFALIHLAANPVKADSGAGLLCNNVAGTGVPLHGRAKARVYIGTAFCH